jgi:hypothetical protein
MGREVTGWPKADARGPGGVPPIRAAGAADARGPGGVPPIRAAGAADGGLGVPTP